MVMVYEYDKAISAIKLFNENRIVTFRVYLDETVGYILDYRTIDEFPTDVQESLRGLFNEKMLAINVQATQVLTKFVTMMATNNVELFDFEYDIATSTFNHHSTYKRSYDEIMNEATQQPTYDKFILQLEAFVTNAGIAKMPIPELYEKTPGTKQQKVRYTQINFEQLVEKLKGVIKSE